MVPGCHVDWTTSQPGGFESSGRINVQGACGVDREPIKTQIVPLFYSNYIVQSTLDI